MPPEAKLRDPIAESFVSKCVPAIVERFEPELVVLFGSRARGEGGEWSDLDLVIVSERFEGVAFIERSRRVHDLINSELDWWECGSDIFCYTRKHLLDVLEVSFCLNEALRVGVVVHGAMPPEAEVAQMDEEGTIIV